MTQLTVFIFIVFFAVLAIFGVISAILFYHVGRYSHLGDTSKRVYSIYSTIGAVVCLAALILLILNHILS